MRKEITIADIVKEHALPLLPAKTLCMMREVCKEWNAWILNPFLAYKQALCFRKFSGLICQSPFDDSSFLISVEPSTCGIPDPNLSFISRYSEKIIKSTCNGLMCYHDCAEQDSLYYICNPVTMQQHSLPVPNYFHWPGTVAVLAFEPSTFNFNSNYELVCAIPTEMDDNDAVYIVFEIFSSRSRSWRVCENICTDFIGPVLTGKGFYSHCVVYWETKGGYLVALDLRTEEYGIIQLPEGSGCQCALAEIGGEICYLMPDKDTNRIAIFGGMKMNLKCMIELHLGYSFEHFETCKVLGLVDNGQVLILLLKDMVIMYHTVEMTYQTLKHFREVEDAQHLNFFPYVNSLVNAISPPLMNE